MELYRYRKIKSAIRDINEGSFYFSPREELNDPIEDCFRVYWKGDKAAWEGLFRNYICSLNQALTLFVLDASTKELFSNTVMRDIHRFDSEPLGKVLVELEELFLKDIEVQRITDYYGDNNLIVNESELCFVLRFIHHKALTLCVKNGIDTGSFPLEPANHLLQSLAIIEKRSFPFEEMNKLNEKLENRAIAVKKVIDLIEDAHEYRYLCMGIDKEGFLYSHDENSNEYTRQRNWISITVDYPTMYIKQIIDLMYAKSYIACFSQTGKDSAMWGNYADNHRGVCFVYETHGFLTLSGEERITIPIKPVQYGGELLERNFFESLGQLALPQIESWLTGTKSISVYYQNYSAHQKKWREEYLKLGEAKPYRKTKDWESEKELRAVLPFVFHNFSTKEKRKLKFDPNILKGVIFGINTSEFDKSQIYNALMRKVDLYKQIKFYQSEYDDLNQCLTIRQKHGWKLEK